LSHACVVPRVWDRGGFDRATTFIGGVRSYALAELDIMDTAGLVVPARPWQTLGSEKLAVKIGDLTARTPLYISLDIDLLDPAHAPGTGYPVAGGPDVREVLSLLSEIWRQQPVAAFDLVEVAPGIDPTGITAANAAHILLQVLGHVAAAP
jgi:agmatinase